MAVWTTTPRTWASGETLTAANMNAQLRDFASGFGAWGSYTPTLSQGVSTNIAKTVTYSKYLQIQKTVTWTVRLDITAAGTAASGITVTLPVTGAYGGGLVAGSGMYVDTSVAWYKAVAFINSTTTLVLLPPNITGITPIGTDPNIAVATGDVFLATVTYEAA